MFQAQALMRYGEGMWLMRPVYDPYDRIHNYQPGNSVFCRLDDYPDDSYYYTEHWHEYLEIIYSLEGAYRISINGIAYELKPGDMIFINARRIHSVYSVGGGVHRNIIIQFEPQIFNSSQRAEYLEAMPFIFTRKANHFLFTAEELALTQVPQAILGICQEEQQRQTGREIAMHMHLLFIFLWMLRFWHRESLSPNERTAMRYLSCIMPAFDYINVNFADHILAGDMAKLCNLSYTHFCRQFRDITGETFTAYVNQVRIGEAQKLLFNSQSTITAISELVGFSDVNYFIRRFKAATGMSPYRFKKISCYLYGSEETNPGGRVSS